MRRHNPIREPRSRPAVRWTCFLPEHGLGLNPDLGSPDVLIVSSTDHVGTAGSARYRPGHGLLVENKQLLDVVSLLCAGRSVSSTPSLRFSRRGSYLDPQGSMIPFRVASTSFEAVPGFSRPRWEKPGSPCTRRRRIPSNLALYGEFARSLIPSSDSDECSCGKCRGKSQNPRY